MDYTVVGVMPEEFAFPVSQRIWIPLRTNPLDYPGDQTPEVFVFARLAPGFTLESAQAEVETLGLLAQNRCGAGQRSLRPRVVPYVAGVLSMDASRRWIGSMVLLLAALLLLPPCANIGILVYARAVTRREEFATRYALGASRGRIVTQMFVESSCSRRQRVWSDALRGPVRLRRAALGSGAAHHGTWECSLLVRFPSLTDVVLCLAGLVVVAAAIAGAFPGMRVTGRWRAGLHALGERGASVGLGRTWTALLAMQVAVAIAVLPVGDAGDMGTS